MKLGLLTAPFEDTSLADVGAWAGENGFSALEVACWPAAGGEARRYAGTSHINVDGLSSPIVPPWPPVTQIVSSEWLG